MAEIPGIEKPEIQALPQIADRMTFIYPEHCKLNRQDGAITGMDESVRKDHSGFAGFRSSTVTPFGVRSPLLK